MVKLNQEREEEILMAISEGVNTGTKISRLFKISQPRISDMLSIMLKRGLLIKGKRTLSQEYVITEKALGIIEDRICLLDILHISLENYFDNKVIKG